jgi:hypothetical protein
MSDIVAEGDGKREIVENMGEEFLSIMLLPCFP